VSARRPGLPALLFAVALLDCGCKDYRGSVRDYETKKAIPDATIFHGGQAVRSDKAGEFVLGRVDLAQPVLIKAAGYRCLRLGVPEKGALTAELEPFETRGVYLSYDALGRPEVRARVMSWLASKRLDTLVIDIKDERGRMTFYNSAPRAGQMGAFGAVKFDDIATFVKDLHQKGVCVVGRISVFRDSALAEHNPEWTVKCKRRSSMFWLDPFREEVRNYNLIIAKEAAAHGFDEIQFDHVRFPEEREAPEARYSRRDTPGNRSNAIARFWREAQRQLASSNVYLSVGTASIGSLSAVGSDASAGPDYFAPQFGSGQGWAGGAGSAGGSRISLRPYIPCGSGMADQGLQAAVAACRAGGTSGWVLWDPDGKYDVSRDLIGTLGARDE